MPFGLRYWALTRFIELKKLDKCQGKSWSQKYLLLHCKNKCLAESVGKRVMAIATRNGNKLLNFSWVNLGTRCENWCSLGKMVREYTITLELIANCGDKIDVSELHKLRYSTII